MHSYHVIFVNGSYIQGTTDMEMDEFVGVVGNTEKVASFTWKPIEEPEEYDEQWPDGEDIQQEPINVDYVVVSTSFMYREIMVFPGNENGDITDWGELGCVPQATSTDHNTAMHTFGMFDDYEFVKVVNDDENPHPYTYQTLWKKK